jgi:hypothetical protein
LFWFQWGVAPVKINRFRMIAVKTLEGMKMRKAVFGLVVLLVFGFVFAGCDNGTTTDNGTAPILTEVWVGTGSPSTTAVSKAFTFTKGTDIYVGVDVSDPDKDIVKVGYSIKKDGTAVPNFTGENDLPLGVETYTGRAFAFMLSQLESDQQSATVGTGYTCEIYFVDEKGNKSETQVSNTFAITD